MFMLCDLWGMMSGQCFYVLIVDEIGGMLNDLVVVKFLEDCWWILIVDSDLFYWVKGIVNGWCLDVLVDELDVFLLGIQGLKFDDFLVWVFGDFVCDIKFFCFGWFQFEGCDLVIVCLGYFKQGGFEIYVDGMDIGMLLWNVLFEVGEDFNVCVGCLNLIECIEGGLLSYGNDMIDDNMLYECGLGKFCNIYMVIGCIGCDVLLWVVVEGLV